MKTSKLLLLACASLLGCTESTENAVLESTVITSTDQRISLDGTWTATCVLLADKFISETFTISGKSIRLDIATFSSAGCTAPADNTEVLNLSFGIGDTYFVELNGVQVKANKISGTVISSATGLAESFKQGFYIDDASSRLSLYHGIFGDDGGKLSSDGYPLELHNIAIIKD